MRAVVSSLEQVAADIIWVELDPLAGAFPHYTPGSHVDFKIPGIGVRQYSLTGDGETYSFAIQKESSGRGGSVYLHDHLRIGAELEISNPRNNFPLFTDKPLLFLAGGIGITPFLSMLHSISSNLFKLLYFTRSRDRSLMSPMLSKLEEAGAVSILSGKTPEETIEIIQKSIDEFTDEARIYCCGPSKLIEAISVICNAQHNLIFHSESFSNVAKNTTNEDIGFHLVLSKSRKRIYVPQGQTILESLRANGVPVDSSCESGLCGTCKIPYESGDVDHRDLILSNDEKKEFLISCCSRSHSEELILSI